MEAASKLVPVIETPAQLPASTQANSQLVSLPRELQTIILKELLIGSTPVETFERYFTLYAPQEVQTCGVAGRWFCVPKPLHLLTRFEVYPAILSTCQALLWDGWSVLYGENTVTMLFMPTGYPALPGRTYLRQSFYTPSLAMRLWQHVHPNEFCICNRPSIERLLRRFGRFQLEVDEKLVDGEGFRLLKSALLDWKHIFGDSKLTLRFVPDGKNRTENLVDILKVFERIRAASFECKDERISPQIRQDVASLVTGAMETDN